MILLTSRPPQDVSSRGTKEQDTNKRTKYNIVCPSYGLKHKRKKEKKRDI